MRKREILGTVMLSMSIVLLIFSVVLNIYIETFKEEIDNETKNNLSYNDLNTNGLTFDIYLGGEHEKR
jgi:hypothetical protein